GELQGGELPAAQWPGRRYGLPEQCQRRALQLAIRLAVIGRLEQQLRKGALPSGNGVQGRSDAFSVCHPLPQPLATPLDPSKSERSAANSYPERELDPRPDANAVGAGAQRHRKSVGGDP